MYSPQKLTRVCGREIIDRFNSNTPQVLDQFAKPLIWLSWVGLDVMVAAVIGVPKIIDGPFIAFFGHLQFLVQAPFVATLGGLSLGQFQKLLLSQIGAFGSIETRIGRIADVLCVGQ